MKERNDNKTHQQRFQGRHARPLAPPVEKGTLHAASKPASRVIEKHRVSIGFMAPVPVGV